MAYFYLLYAAVVILPCWYLRISDLSKRDLSWEPFVRSTCPYLVECARYRPLTFVIGMVIQSSSTHLVICLTDIEEVSLIPALIAGTCGMLFGCYLFKELFSQAIDDWFRFNEPANSPEE